MAEPSPKPARRRRSPSRSDPAILAELLALHTGPGPFSTPAGAAAASGAARCSSAIVPPTRLDAHHETRPDLVGDWNRRSDLFAPASFVTALWDPPYISDAGGGLVGKARWGARYGTRGPGLRADSVCHLFRPFLLSVRQVLDPRHDTLLVKLGDQVHQGELQWQPFELRRVALELGWLPCDYQVRVRAQPLDPKWKTQRHAPRRDVLAGVPSWSALPQSRP